jgi:major membrane immunogen (membrane-anchored lipoprotein)
MFGGKPRLWKGEMTMKSTLSILAAALLLVACGGKQPDMVVTAATQAPAPKAATEASTLPPGHPNVQPVADRMTSKSVASAPAGSLTGKVIETMNAGGYTYLNVQTAQGNVWAAVREFKAKKGDIVAVNAEMTMDNFESKTLNRKFDHIVFGSLASSAPVAAPKAQEASMLSGGASPMGSPSQHMTTPNAGDVKVPKAEGTNGKTIAELWAGKDSLKGKTIVVRGKVVKSLSGIMGKNWIHLRDGSSEKDITVTTDASANVGEVIVVTGTLTVDKDFGAGYMYPVIIEDGKITK